MTYTEAQLKQIIETYSTEIELCLREREVQEDQWLKWIESYKGRPKLERKTYPWPDASNLVIGLGAIYVDSIVARIMQDMFSLEPHWIATEMNKKFSEHVKPVENYLDWIRQNTWDQYRVVKPMVLDVVKLGTGILTNGWEDSQYIQTINDSPQKTLHVIGPRPRWVPRVDFVCPSGFSDIQTSPWVAYRVWYTYTELQRLQYSGWLENIDKIKDNNDNPERLHTAYRSDPDLPMDRSPDDPSALWSPWQIWFQQDLDGDDYPEQHVALIHLKSKEVLRIRPNPYTGGMRPFVKATFIDQEGEFDGVGVPEMVDQYQEEASTIHNQRRDNAHLANTRMVIARKGSGITDKTKFFPGKIWLVTDPKSDLQEFRVGEVYPSSTSDEQLTIGLAERRVGISDVSLGRESPPIGRAAATTVMALLQEGTRRFDLNTSEFRRALSEQGLQILELFQTHGLPAPDDPGSPEQVLDDDDAVKLRQLLSLPDGVRGVLGLRLNVSTAAVNKEVEKQSTLQLLGVVTNYFQQFLGTMQMAAPLLLNPQTPPPIKEMLVRVAAGVDKMMERVFQAHSVFDLDSILIGDVVAEMAGMGGPNAQGLQNPMASTQTTTPGGNGNVAGAGLNQLLGGLSQSSGPMAGPPTGV